MAFGLLLHGLPEQRFNIFYGALAKRRSYIELFIGEKAQAQFAISGKAQTIAGAAKMVGHRGDESDRSERIGKLPVTRRPPASGHKCALVCVVERIGSTQASLKLLFSALDSYDAQGNSVVKNDAEWLFTSKQAFTTHGLTIGFSQEYKPGYFYTSVQTDTGADVMGEESPLATDANLRLAHVDYANLQASDAVAIAAAPSAFEQLGSFFQTLDWSPLLVTLKTTGTAIIFIFILGLLAAWWTLRLKPRTQSIMDAIFTIPMVLPPTVCGFLLLMFLGRNTPVGAWFDQIGLPLVFSWQATVIAAVVVAFPLMYRSARGAFESIDADMLDAARTLGWSEGRIFFRLMLPLAWSLSLIHI